MLQLMDMVCHRRGGVYMYIGFNIDFGIFSFLCIKAWLVVLLVWRRFL